MAALPEGMKQHRSPYGSTTYTYKGVSIGKYRDDYCLRAELLSQSGKFYTDYMYGAYRLSEVPAMVERYLANEFYILDEFGTFRLTEARKAELIELARERVAKEIEVAEAKTLEAVQAKDWQKVANYAQHILKLKDKNAWMFENEDVAA
jgi:hypothetical protein